MFYLMLKFYQSPLIPHNCPCLVDLEIDEKDKVVMELWQLQAVLFVCPRIFLRQFQKSPPAKIRLGKITYFVYDICLKLVGNAAKI